MYAPVRVRLVDGSIEIANRHAFRDLSHLRCDWTQTADGEVVASGELPLPEIAAGGSAVVRFDHEPAGEGERFLTLRFTLKESEPWADAGHEVAVAQVELPPGPPAASTAGDRPSLPATAEVLRGFFPILLKEPRLTLWRSPIDNECRGSAEKVGPAWRTFGLHMLRPRTVGVERDGEAVVVRETLAPSAGIASCHIVYRYEPADGGGVRLAVSGEFEGDWPAMLPRIALALELPADCDRVAWFGRGPGECYVDSIAAAPVGRYETGVDEMHVDYARPQDNGLRTAVRWASLARPGGEGLRFNFEPHGDLQAHRYATADLDAADHACDLKRDRGRVFVHLGHRHTGLGSHSCGPGLEERHRLAPEAFSFAVVVRRVG